MAIQSMLVAVDLTEEAGEVLAKAQALADAATTVHVVTVIRPVASMYGGPGGMMTVPTELVGLDADARKHGETAVRELAQQQGLQDATVHSLLGKPSTEIRQLAEELGVEVIVIGTHGRSGLGLMLGSTANAVMHGVPCDVYAVKIAN